MRIKKKRKILRKLMILQDRQEEFVEYAGRDTEKYNYDFLTEWQEEAIGLGNILEEEQLMILVSKIEKYCEGIYECSLVLRDEEKLLEKCQKLKVILDELSSDIREIPAKVKIAFFPYKISMWDSLESIWEATSRDENCECQVIPIPYYIKNKAGEIEREKYEGTEFAASVPVTDYRTYVIEKEKPDIMYIHNPYDQYNKVTMIDPHFFSAELKKGGGILVYVPYYVSGYCSKYENMLDVCGNIGAVHSDYVIVQSENLKKAYVFCGFPEKRLLPLGTPKIDAVQKINTKKYEIEKKWKPVIKNRKVILLNTSISASIQDDGWLDHIREFVLPILKNERLALIWRPHPLLLETEKVFTEGEEAYDDLVKMFLNAPNVIIDDSEIAEAAMKVSDAMISDYSSLVMQYCFTGKPAYILTGKSTGRKYHVFCDYFSNYFREDGISLEEFLDIVIQEKDVKREERIVYAKSSIENTDGTCGEKVHQEIYKKWMERIK